MGTKKSHPVLCLVAVFSSELSGKAVEARKGSGKIVEANGCLSVEVPHVQLVVNIVVELVRGKVTDLAGLGPKIMANTRDRSQVCWWLLGQKFGPDDANKTLHNFPKPLLLKWVQYSM